MKTKMSRWSWLGVTACAVILVGPNATAANAAVPPLEPAVRFAVEDRGIASLVTGRVLDPQLFLRGLEDLEASTVTRNEIVAGATTFYEYVVPEGALTLPSAADVRASIEEAGFVSGAIESANPLIEVQFSGIKMAVGFNTVDQQALLAGGGAVLAAAICLIPAVGWAACAVVGVVVGVATTYLAANGICSGGRTLWWYDVKGGSVTNCRYSAPYRVAG